MADELFRDPRLATLYDALDPDRVDLAAYLRLVEEAGARKVLDLGCGTGVLALLLAERGAEVVAADPAEASLEVARRKPGAERVHWVHGDASELPPLQVDVITMTANVVQEITEDEGWRTTLRGAYKALRPGGLLVFETREPTVRAWEGWTREATRALHEIPGVGPVERWQELLEVNGPLVAFRSTFVFAPGQEDEEVRHSYSTLRFRGRAEVEADLTAGGFVVEDVRGAPDRPGRELVFLARRPVSPLHGAGGSSAV